MLMMLLLSFLPDNYRFIDSIVGTIQALHRLVMAAVFGFRSGLLATCSLLSHRRRLTARQRQTTSMPVNPRLSGTIYFSISHIHLKISL